MFRSCQWHFILVLLGLFASCKPSSVKTGYLPNSSEMACVEAKLNGDFLSESSIESFKVDEQFFDKLSKCLSTNPLEAVDSSAFGKSIGILKIIDRKGNLYRVEFPWSGKNVLVFTVNGKWFSRNGTLQSVDPSSGEELAFAADESMLLYKALRKQYEEKNTKEIQDSR